MRDYAKRRAPKKTQPPSDGAGIVLFLVLCSILFVAYVAYHFLHGKAPSVKKKITTTAAITKHDNKKRWIEHKIIKPIERDAREKRIEKEKEIIQAEKFEKKIHTKKQIKKAIALNPADIQPKYDFYKLLPAMKVTIPEEDQPSKITTTLAAPT